MVQCGSQGIEVRTRISIALVLLRWSIAWRPQCRGLFTSGIASNIRTRNPKIDQVGSSIFGPDDDISRLDVTMHNWRRLLRQVVKYVQDFRRIPKPFAFLHRRIET